MEVHPATLIVTRWIGVDLNTTGYVAVVIDIFKRENHETEKKIRYNHHQSSKNCTKLWKERLC
jgi:hypothetical protein